MSFNDTLSQQLKGQFLQFYNTIQTKDVLTCMIFTYVLKNDSRKLL